MSNGRGLWFGMGIAGALQLCGCDGGSSKNTEPPLRTAKSLNVVAAPGIQSPASGDPTTTTERNFDGAIFQVPGDWEEVPYDSRFIKAEFRIKSASGPARLTLSTAKGSVEENIIRWKGQFARSVDDPPSKESTLTVDRREATLVELFGRFTDMRTPGEPQPNSALLGVVIPLKTAIYFIKLTGPRETVAEVREAFLMFVESARFKE